MKNPLVSIALVTYNQREFLGECIDSILSQDYKNIEIVVADDGSTDGSQDILLRYQKKYPDKFVLKLSAKNQGITKNCNIAHFTCTGEYIAWMAGDDLMMQGKIGKQVAYMEKHPNCTISYHNLEVFDSVTGNKLYNFNSKHNAYEGAVEIVIKHGTFNGACSNMVRRGKTPKHGFNENIRIASDWLYWIETLMNGGKIHYMDEVLGQYRKHNNNITSKKAFQANMEHILTTGIIITKYPKFTKEALSRMIEVVFGIGNDLIQIIISHISRAGRII